ncbi:hypothetical protein AR687_11300 [Flavobacteriaceae bacterium CRH]|nr:hypothetical protein AR687_11300 [Flavobacteriaceae bacterium CRH]
MYLIIVFCSSHLFVQCSSDDNKKDTEQPVIEQYTDDVIMLRKFLSTSLHIDINKIIYDSGISSFIIDGDVVMPIEEARDHYSDSSCKNSNKTNQQYSGYKMKPEMAGSVQVYISPEVTSEWRIAINKAIIIWNNTNSSINITTTNTTTSLSINIIMGEIPEKYTIANASYPSGGGPGKRMKINTIYMNKLNDTDRLHTIIHELGHNFGLGHTEETEGSLIPCTSSKDIGSIMFGMHDDNTAFTYFDNVAISTLYPIAIGTKKLYKYRKDQYYFYTTDPCEIIPSKDGYLLVGDAGYLYETQIPGTVPLYRILNGSTVKDHKLNKNQTSSNDVILGYLYPTQQPGTTALYSYGIYESKPGQTPSYMYHYDYTTTNSEAILKVIVGYVSNKTIIKETPEYPILL